jgi:hypothetical protein
MILEQAIYGVVRSGHGLRAASGDRRLADELSHRLDLPDTAPPGADWSPYVSGFPHRDHYVLARTFSDPFAGRPGMVLTHALIAPLDEFVAFSDLRRLFDRLILSPDQTPAELGNLSIDPGDGVPPPTAVDLTAAATALVARATGPVVRIGSAGLEDLVAALWERFWPTLRRHFSFRLSFGPGDLVEVPPPTLVCTPASLIGRWQQHRIVDRAGDGTSLAAAMLEGSEAGTTLRAFAESIGAELATFAELPLLEQAHRMATAHPEIFGRVLAAVRLVDRLSPDPKRGATDKQALVDRLVAALAQALPSDVLALRNVSLLGFPAEQSVWQGLEGWCERHGFPPDEDADLLLILRDTLLDGDARDEWRRAVSRGIHQAARHAELAFASGFWRWTEADHSIAAPLLALVDPDGAIEARLVGAAPAQLTRQAVESLLRIFAERRLPALHAAAAGAGLPPLEAARLQCKIQSGTDAAAMRLALRRAAPTEILDCAMEIGDQRIIRIAGDVVAGTPALLADRDIAMDVNRSIWSVALGVNSEAWRGPADPRRAFDDVLLDVIAGRRVPPRLVEQLSGTPLADLSSFNRRSELWRHVDGQARSRLLGATVDAWFADAADNDRDPALETELQERILSDPRLDRLLDRLAKGQVAAGFRVMSALPGLEDARFRRWINAAVRGNHSLAAQEVRGRQQAAHSPTQLSPGPSLRAKRSLE